MEMESDLCENVAQIDTSVNITEYSELHGSLGKLVKKCASILSYLSSRTD